MTTTTEAITVPAEWNGWDQNVRGAWLRLYQTQQDNAASTSLLRRYLPARMDAMLLEVDAYNAAEMVAFAGFLLAQLAQRYPEVSLTAEWLLYGADNGDAEPLRIAS